MTETTAALIARLRELGESYSEGTRMLAEARAAEHGDGSSYQWLKPEETPHWKAADALERLETLLRARDADVAEQVRTNVAINDEQEALVAENARLRAALENWLNDIAMNGKHSITIDQRMREARAALAGEPA